LCVYTGTENRIQQNANVRFIIVT